MTSDLPEPGEVWVLVEPKYGPESYDKIRDDGPIIITYLTTTKIGFAYDNGEPSGGSHFFVREGTWKWHEHFLRIWPRVPSWEELGKDPALSEG